jgi:hypothetical protein
VCTYRPHTPLWGPTKLHRVKLWATQSIVKPHTPHTTAHSTVLWVSSPIVQETTYRGFPTKFENYIWRSQMYCIV